MKKILIFGAMLSMLLAAVFAAASSRNTLTYTSVRGLVASSRSAEISANAHWQAKVDEFRLYKGHADIVMLGDSLTEHRRWQEIFPPQSIINRGISGDGVDGALLRLDQITAAQPRLVFIMIGVNDIRRSIGPDDVAASYGKIINRLADVDSIVVQSTLFTSSEVQNNAAIKRLNSALLALCSNAANCRFLDLNASLSRNDSLRPDFTIDGLHLNGDGYRVWEDQIRPMMAAGSTGR